jgi:hypothetical protein
MGKSFQHPKLGDMILVAPVKARNMKGAKTMNELSGDVMNTIFLYAIFAGGAAGGMVAIIVTLALNALARGED